MSESQFSGEFPGASPSSKDERRPAGDSPGDADLVKRVLRGDPESYRPLVERYQRAVLGLSIQLLGPGGDAEDLAQESLVRAYRYLNSLKEQERFGPWLFQVVRSLARDRKRRRDAEKKALQSRRDMIRWAAVPGGPGIGPVLYRLPPQEYQVLRMRYFEGLEYEEIGRRMAKTFSQVDHLIRKARAHLGRIIARENDGERNL